MMSNSNGSDFQSRIQQELQTIKRVAKEVIAVYCSTKLGLPISNIGQTSSEIQEALVSAMSSALHGTAEQMTILEGNFEIMIVQASQGWILIQGEENILVTVLTKPKINIGLVLLAAKRATRRISQLLNEGY